MRGVSSSRNHLLPHFSTLSFVCPNHPTFRLGYDIESYVMDYIVEKGLRMRAVPYLHVVANIDNRGFLNYF